MNPLFLNAAILPLFATIFFPDAFRNRQTGEFLGFLNLEASVYLVVIFVVEMILVSDEFGFSFTTSLRGLFITLLPFVGGIAFTFYSHKYNYGIELDISKRKK